METWKRFAIGLLMPVLALGGCKEKRKSGVIYHTPGEYVVQKTERTAQDFYNELKSVAPFLEKQGVSMAALDETNANYLYSTYKNYYQLHGVIQLKPQQDGTFRLNQENSSSGTISVQRYSGYSTWTFYFSKPVYIIPSVGSIRLNTSGLKSGGLYDSVSAYIVTSDGNYRAESKWSSIVQLGFSGVSGFVSEVSIIGSGDLRTTQIEAKIVTKP